MKNIIYLFALIFLVGSCQKTTNDEITANEVSMKGNVIPLVSNVTSKEGRLVFKSKSDFNSTIKVLFENQKKIENFETQFSGFTSNKQAFERIDSTFLRSVNYNFDLVSNYAIIIETPEGKSLERVIDNHLLASLFNDEGILQIGDSIFKFSYDFTYKFNVNKLSQLKSAKLDLSTSDVIAYPNIRSRFELPTKSLKSVKASVSEFRFHYEKLPNGTPDYDKFIKCELNRNITYLYNALTVDSKSRKINWLGIGVAYTMQELYVGFEGYFRVVGGLGEGQDYYYWCEDHKYGGTTDVQETIYSCGPGYGTPEFVSGRCLGYHGYKVPYDLFRYISENTSY